MSKRSDSPGLGSLASGALTAASILVVVGVSAVVGIVIAREFGRTDETDGLLAAYGVFIVIAIAANASRVVLLPQLARAQREERLAGELAGFALALVVLVGPLVVAAEAGAGTLAEVLTGGGPESAQAAAADALRWMVPAGAAHLFAALAASGLAALDDYGTAALGYAAGSASGLALILWRVEPDGIVAIAWGMALNGAVSLLVPLAGLAVRAARARMPRGAVRPRSTALRARFGIFAVGVALPLALQLLYVVCLPFAGREGTGAATSFVYAYLAASAFVAVTAGSLGLVSSVPLARSEFGPERASRHVVATSWVALVLVGAAVGVFALAGGTLVEAVLGDAYGGDVGDELGGLVVALSPWMIASIGVSVTFPLAFVAGRTRGLPLLAVGVVALQVPLAWGASAAFELEGLALAFAVSTLVVLAVLLVELRALETTARGLLAASAAVGGLAAVAFAPPALVLGPVAAASVGLAAYLALVALARPPGLRSGWHYLRGLS